MNGHKNQTFEIFSIVLGTYWLCGNSIKWDSDFDVVAGWRFGKSNLLDLTFLVASAWL